jgi:hypothetical protein
MQFFKTMLLKGWFEQYEVSNFSKPAMESSTIQVIGQGNHYLGLAHPRIVLMEDHVNGILLITSNT